MHKTLVINAVGLSASLISDANTPRLAAFRRAGKQSFIESVVPAVTTTVQSTYLTGTWPNEHGIVGNGWYFRDTSEVRFWLQSNRLVEREKIWDKAKRIDPSFTCANLFWWYNMYSTADYSVTPRPMYPADGRKIPDVYSKPESLRGELQAKLGTFPLFNFWGPATNIAATRWIADSAIEVDQRFNPTLTLVYLPHLDYVLQRNGPASADTDLRELDAECGKLIDYFQRRGARIIILSEYGITPVSLPVHLNRVLRQAGLLAVRDEMGRELLDAGASAGFAVADHQVAHVYVNDPARLDVVRRLLEATPGVARVLDEAGKRELHLDHPRSGELICLADADAWFTYYYWLDDVRAPDFARTVDIHRKPGYDPVELFLDPGLSAPKLKIAWALARRKMGFRTLMDVIPLDATLVKGSHGLPPRRPEEGALLLTSETSLVENDAIGATDVCGVMLRHLGLRLRSD
jgi:predicted AlkP superfamily pyrophosphatase or phosphodiesterase